MDANKLNALPRTTRAVGKTAKQYQMVTITDKH